MEGISGMEGIKSISPLDSSPEVRFIINIAIMYVYLQAGSRVQRKRTLILPRTRKDMVI